MTEAHVALPRPTPPPPVTDTMSGQTSHADLTLAAAAYAIETPAPDTPVLLAATLAPLVQVLGAAPGPTTTPATQYAVSLWAGLGLLVAAPGQYRQAEDRALQSALSATTAPYRAIGDVRRFGEFVLGDGTRLGDRDDDTADLLRETALAGVVLHAAAVTRQSEGYLSAAGQALRAALARFRAPDGSLYAHAVTPGRMAGFGRDSEAEALLGLLCLRLRADEYADELLDSVEGYAAARLTERGHAKGYSQDGTMPNISIRASLLVAVFQREAGRYAAARNTLRGLEPLRGDNGLLSGFPALTVAAEAATDHRYFLPRMP